MSEDHNQHQADHIPDTTEMIPYSVYIEDAHVCFSIGNQHFALGFEVDYELDYPIKYQLDWMKAQLDHALTALARQGWQSVENVSAYLDDLRGGADDELLQVYPDVDWEAVAADQAMTIAIMKSEQAEFQALVAKVQELEKQACEIIRREWVGLTDDEIRSICDENYIMLGAYAVDFMKAIETKLKEKNT